jgi:glucokinase
MAAASHGEDAIMDYLRRQFGHMSAERVVSGGGLENLYRAVVALDGIDAPKRNAAEITKTALDGTCPIARTALDPLVRSDGAQRIERPGGTGEEGGVSLIA